MSLPLFIQNCVDMIDPFISSSPPAPAYPSAMNIISPTDLDIGTPRSFPTPSPPLEEKLMAAGSWESYEQITAFYYPIARASTPSPSSRARRRSASPGRLPSLTPTRRAPTPPRRPSLLSRPSSPHPCASTFSTPTSPPSTPTRPRRRPRSPPSPSLYKQVLQTNFSQSPSGQKSALMGIPMAAKLWDANRELEKLVMMHCGLEPEDDHEEDVPWTHAGPKSFLSMDDDFESPMMPALNIVSCH